MGWFLYPTDVVTTAILRVSFLFFILFILSLSYCFSWDQQSICKACQFLKAWRTQGHPVLRHIRTGKRPRWFLLLQ